MDNRTDKQRLGSLVKLMRLTRGMTQMDLAERVNTKQTNISRIERGAHQVSLSVASQLAEGLDATLNELLEAARDPDLTEWLELREELPLQTQQNVLALCRHLVPNVAATESEESLEPLGSFTKRWRTARGWSQRKLGDLTGVPQTSISRIERGGERISLRFAIALAEVFGVTPDDFASLGQDPANDEWLGTWAELSPEKGRDLLALCRKLRRSGPDSG